MDAQQLKLLAGRIRDLLEHANVSVTPQPAVKKALPRTKWVGEFLAQGAKRTKAAA